MSSPHAEVLLPLFMSAENNNLQSQLNDIRQELGALRMRQTMMPIWDENHPEFKNASEQTRMILKAFSDYDIEMKSTVSSIVNSQVKSLQNDMSVEILLYVGVMFVISLIMFHKMILKTLERKFQHIFQLANVLRNISIEIQPNESIEEKLDEEHLNRESSESASTESEQVNNSQYNPDNVLRSQSASSFSPVSGESHNSNIRNSVFLRS
jgi:hypothetical protein